MLKLKNSTFGYFPTLFENIQGKIVYMGTYENLQSNPNINFGQQIEKNHDSISIDDIPESDEENEDEGMVNNQNITNDDTSTVSLDIDTNQPQTNNGDGAVNSLLSSKVRF